MKSNPCPSVSRRRPVTREINWIGSEMIWTRSRPDDADSGGPDGAGGVRRAGRSEMEGGGGEGIRGSSGAGASTFFGESPKDSIFHSTSDPSREKITC